MRNIKFYEHDSFKQLQLHWYTQLKNSGFHDHELVVGTGTELQQSFNHSYHCNPVSEHQIEMKRSYYLALERCIEDEVFSSKRDLIIMTMTAKGLMIKEIGEKLDEQGYRCHRQTIRFVIRRFEHKWNIRYWNKHQLTSNLVTQSSPTQP